MNKFKIYDWTGRDLYMHGTFETFEAAWDYIYGEMSDNLNLTEDDFQEYYVESLDAV